MKTLHRFLRVVAILSGLTWGGLAALAIRGPESASGEWWRAATFVLMVGAALLAGGCDEKGNTDETL